MSIVDGIKDTARKASNIVVDTTEKVLGTPKSPKELAKRLSEHLTHQEYSKIAEIITEEARKYIAKLKLDNIVLVNKKLEEFERSMGYLAEDFEEGDYRQIVLKLKEVEKLVSTDVTDQVPMVSEMFKTIKGFVSNIIETLEEYANEEKKGADRKEPDFSKLQSVFEGYFNKLITK